MKIIKMAIFYPMFWVRGLFLFIEKFVASLFLLAAIFIGVLSAAAEEGDIAWGKVFIYGICSFMIFMLCQFYDQILLKLNPTGNDLTLYQ